MKRLNKIYLAITLTGAILFLFSCTPETCFEETETYLKASFYNDVTKGIRAPDSVTIYGLNMESNKLYSKAKKITSALLPLYAATDTCIYIIRINGVTDTLEFRYSSYPHLVSKECGYTFYHEIDTPVYTLNAINFIYLNNKNITLNDEENIRIYY